MIICDGCASKFYVNATNECAPCPQGCESNINFYFNKYKNANLIGCYLGYLPNPVTHRKDSVPVVTCT